MKTRDIRAIAICAAGALLVAALSAIATRNYVATVGLTGAYAAIAFTRPRMVRVLRRLRGVPDWRGYYKND